MVFIGTYSEKDNYLLEMATTVTTFGYPVDFILEKHNKELELQVPFNVNVIGKLFRWSILQSLWVYSKIMWYTLRNIRTHSVYIVEDMYLVPVFKLLGNKVVYYKKDVNYNTTMDAIIGNVCLSNANLILIPLNRKRLRFEKIAVVDPSNTAAGMEAITSLLYNTLPRRICALWMEERSEVQTDKESPSAIRKLEVIAEEHESEGGVQNEDTVISEHRVPSRTESELEEVDGESDHTEIPSLETVSESETSVPGTENQESEKVSETNSRSLTAEKLPEGAEALASTSKGKGSPNDKYKGIIKKFADLAISDTDVEPILTDQFDNISKHYVPLDANHFEDARKFLERERTLKDEDQVSGDSEVSIVLN